MASEVRTNRNRSNVAVDSFDEDFLNDSLSILCEKSSWRVSKVTPLQNLQYSVVKLKQYAAKIKQALSSSVSEIASMRYKAVFEVEKHLRFSSEDPGAIHISVFSKKVDDDSAEYKLSYEGVLMSWGVYLKDEHSTHLPFLFDRGQQSILKLVRQTLSKLFDCSITNFTFTQHHLLLFSGMLCQTIELSKSKTVEFAYTTRETIYRQKMTVQWEAEKMSKIWKSTCLNLPAALSYEQKLKCAFTAYKMFQNQIFRTFSLDLSMLDLIEVTYPKVSVKSSGFLRVRDGEIAKCLLNVLNDLLLYCVDKSSFKNNEIGFGTLTDFHNR